MKHLLMKIIESGILLTCSSYALANGITPESVPNAALINEGRELFFTETFDGNGRTCGTCHPANNNYTIDPEFIAQLPDDDPLFVAEYLPALAENFEKPELMRKAGLILANTNGFSDLENNYTMRSVPHILALSTTITPPTISADDGTSMPPVHRTGWSGDGAPVGRVTDGGNTIMSDGSLRSFPVGAVIQHFPKTLNRQPGVDFRLPTEHELDAMEAFMLSIGRQEEFDDFTRITLNSPMAEQGRKNYMGEGLPSDSLNCNACHFNGGANTDPDFDFSISEVTTPAFESTNRSFAPRVEELQDQEGDLLAQLGALEVTASELPFDDGFAKGTNLFNVPPVIEAADTSAFFHSNQVNTIEGMISFYASKRHFRDGTTADAIVPLNGSQLTNVSAFVKVLNADENGRQALELTQFAEELKGKDRQLNIALAKSEIADAIKVLREGHLHFIDAVPLFELALQQIDDKKLHQARRSIGRARNIMINRPDQQKCAMRVADTILDYAQTTYPDLFDRRETQADDDYLYRYYPKNDMYLSYSLFDDSVYGLGGTFGDSITYIKSVPLLIDQIDELGSRIKAIQGC